VGIRQTGISQAGISQAGISQVDIRQTGISQAAPAGRASPMATASLAASPGPDWMLAVDTPGPGH
jgi:hypothetical protein